VPHHQKQQEEHQDFFRSVSSFYFLLLQMAEEEFKGEINITKVGDFFVKKYFIINTSTTYVLIILKLVL